LLSQEYQTTKDY